MNAAQLLLDAFPGAELIEVGEDPFEDATCTWSGCDEADVLMMVRNDPWCLAHGVDDALPRVMPRGGLNACTQCGRGCATKLDDGTPMHPDCRRNFKARRAQATKPKGAYARRAQRGAGSTRK